MLKSKYILLLVCPPPPTPCSFKEGSEEEQMYSMSIKGRCPQKASEMTLLKTLAARFQVSYSLDTFDARASLFYY